MGGYGLDTHGSDECAEKGVSEKGNETVDSIK
jgi:hypothetical protein